MPAGRDNTKKNLIDCGLRLFREKGFDNVTIEDICAEAGVTRNAFYYYFKEKEQIFDSISEEPYSIGINAISDMVLTKNNWDKLWRLCEARINWITGLGGDLLVNITISNLRRHKSTVLGEDISVYRDMARTIIKAGQESGQFKNSGPPGLAYETLDRVIVGTVIEWCNKEEGFDIKEVIKERLQFLLGVETCTQ